MGFKNTRLNIKKLTSNSDTHKQETALLLPISGTKLSLNVSPQLGKKTRSMETNQAPNIKSQQPQHWTSSLHHPGLSHLAPHRPAELETQSSSQQPGRDRACPCDRWQSARLQSLLLSRKKTKMSRVYGESWEDANQDTFPSVYARWKRKA